MAQITQGTDIFKKFAFWRPLALVFWSWFFDRNVLFSLAVSLLYFDSKGPSKLYKTVSRILMAQITQGTEIF